MIKATELSYSTMIIILAKERVSSAVIVFFFLVIFIIVNDRIFTLIAFKFLGAA